MRGPTAWRQARVAQARPARFTDRVAWLRVHDGPAAGAVTVRDGLLFVLFRDVRSGAGGEVDRSTRSVDSRHLGSGHNAGGYDRVDVARAVPVTRAGPRWQPRNLADIHVVLDAGLTVERHWLDAKRDIGFSTSKRVVLAHDLASFVNDHGTRTSAKIDMARAMSAESGLRPASGACWGPPIR